jgi:homoserine dehydrogenase
MPNLNLALIGFGNVGRALLRLLSQRECAVESQYGITFTVTGIATGRHGMAIDPDGLDLERALQLGEMLGQSVEPLSTASRTGICDRFLAPARPMPF